MISLPLECAPHGGKRRHLALPVLDLLLGLILWWLAVLLLSGWSPVIAESSPQAAFEQLLIGLRSGVLISMPVPVYSGSVSAWRSPCCWPCRSGCNWT